MTIEFTYTKARKQFASLLEMVSKDREIILIQRRGYEDVAMISASELASLTENCLSFTFSSQCRADFICPGKSIEGRRGSTGSERPASRGGT
jgi:prevent-host-death family protein